MPSLIPGYEYDIFISYRQKDNKGDRWVSEFVEALKTELESTFKEEISVYFDINPHGGLLETHDVGWPMLDETLYMLYLYPQLYVDIALIDWAIPQKEFYYYLKRIVDAGFGDRIMFGSDQMVWPESIELAIQAINSADFLSESQKRDILYNNAARFLKFSEETISAHMNPK